MNKLTKYIVESRFNFNIDQLDIEDNGGEFTLSKQQYKSKSMKQEYLEDNLFVDLGLPSGTKWCKYNLGCDFEKLNSNLESTSPKDWYGNYYAWGEIKPKDEYTWKSYKFEKNISNKDYNFVKYCTDSNYGYNGFTDNLSELLPEDDAAYQTNSSCRISSKEQCQELIDYTDSRWISGKGKNLYMNVKGLAGRLFISKINGNQLFIPAAGWKSSSSRKYDGSCCDLQTSSLDADYPGYAWHLCFDSDSINMYEDHRYYGRSIRPILK